MQFWTSRERSSQTPNSPTNRSITTDNSNLSIYSFYRRPRDSAKMNKFCRSLNEKECGWRANARQNEHRASISRAKQRKSEILWKYFASDKNWEERKSKIKRSISQAQRRENRKFSTSKNQTRQNELASPSEISQRDQMGADAGHFDQRNSVSSGHLKNTLRNSFLKTSQELTKKLKQISLNCQSEDSKFKIHMLRANLSYRNFQYEDAYRNAKRALSKNFDQFGQRGSTPFDQTEHNPQISTRIPKARCT